MARMLEATFYNEDAAQNAITSLENENIDIRAVALSSSARALWRRRLKTRSTTCLAARPGFAYSTLPTDVTPSISAYPMPTATAIIADDGLRANHKFSINTTGSIPHEKEDVTGSSVVLTMRADSDNEGKAENILRLCGAYRIRFH